MLIFVLCCIFQCYLYYLSVFVQYSGEYCDNMVYCFETRSALAGRAKRKRDVCESMERHADEWEREGRIERY